MNLRSRRVIQINIDGLRADMFYALLDGGKLPHFASMLSEGLWVHRCMSVFPSVTLASQASLLTGCYPEKHHILGNSWFDRYGKTSVYRDYLARDSALHTFGVQLFGGRGIFLGPRDGEPLISLDLNGHSPTIFERMDAAHLRTGGVFTPISRGVTYWRRPSRMDMIKYALCTKDRAEYWKFDRAVCRRAEQFIHSTKKLPRYLQIYLPGLDGYCHRHGLGDKANDYIVNVLDPIFGRVLKAFAQKQSLEEIHFILTSDHGLSSVNPDSAHTILVDHVAGILAECGCVPWHSEMKGKTIRESDAVISNQGGSMHIHIKNRGSKHWYDPTRPAEDLAPIAEKLTELSRRGFGPIAPGWLEAILTKDHANHNYSIFLDGEIRDSRRFFLERAALYPEALTRLYGYFGHRSADLVLLSNYDGGFYFSDKPHAAQHGHLCAGDSLVPLIIGGPGVRGGILPRASIIDVAPTIASMFGLQMPNADGRPISLIGKSHQPHG